jgi:protein-tyrosine phosphatase
MLLEVVGVPRSTVLADYSRSADLVNYEGVLTREPAARLGLAREGFSMASLARERRAPLLASDPSYLSAAFEAVEAVAGSVEGYLLNAVGIDRDTLTAIRAELLD